MGRFCIRLKNVLEHVCIIWLIQLWYQRLWHGDDCTKNPRAGRACPGIGGAYPGRVSGFFGGLVFPLLNFGGFVYFFPTGDHS